MSVEDPDNLLGLPVGIGRQIVESGAAIVCPLLGINNFVSFCNKRGFRIDRNRLFRLERLGVFSPVFRVREPDEDVYELSIPPDPENNWFEYNWAWDTTIINSSYDIPDVTDRYQEAYYSIFQIHYLKSVLSGLDYNLQLDGFLESSDSEEINWNNNGERWLSHAGARVESLRHHEYQRSVDMLCQYISNRYFPLTRSDQRMIIVPAGPRFHSDKLTYMDASDWDWYEYSRNWDPHDTEKLFNITPKRLRHAYEGLSVIQSFSDPLEKWYQLVQFVKVRERDRLKGGALEAETLRSGAHMLRLLYKDLYGEELPHPNEITGAIIKHIPELEIRSDIRRYLEFVANRYGVNPQPKICLIVEGRSEEAAITYIFEEYFGIHPGKCGIEIVPLGGVDSATGGKSDRFRAILRLVDYLHYHQTITFLILDNEGHSKRLKQNAKTAKSVHRSKRHITRQEYIKIWKTSFEFDNFSCSEIAKAMSNLGENNYTFARNEILSCKNNKNPNKKLQKYYKEKTGRGLNKIRLAKLLVEGMLSKNSTRKITNRPIVKILLRIERLSVMNPLPTMQKSWEKNQNSKYLGKKHLTVKKNGEV